MKTYELFTNENLRTFLLLKNLRSFLLLKNLRTFLDGKTYGLFLQMKTYELFTNENLRTFLLLKNLRSFLLLKNLRTFLDGKTYGLFLQMKNLRTFLLLKKLTDFLVYKKYNCSTLCYSFKFTILFMMGRRTFAFNNVLTVDKVDEFYIRIENEYFINTVVNDGSKKYIQYMGCIVEKLDTTVILQEMKDCTYPKLRNVTGIIQFRSKQKLRYVKRFLLTCLGKTMCRHLFVAPVPNVDKFHGSVKEKEVGACRMRVWGKFKNRKNKSRI